MDQLLYLSVFLTITSSLPNEVSALSSLTNVNTSSCDVSKSCFRQPDQCTTGKCSYILTWTADDGGQFATFELEAAVSALDSYVAFGLSTDKKMGSDSVVECVYNDATKAVIIQSSWNTGDDNTVNSNNQLGLVPGSTSGAYVNGYITCRFQRLMNVSGSSTVYPLDSATYYILLAQGPASGGVKREHKTEVVSSNEVNFTALASVSGSSRQLAVNLIKAHGILMVFAWMVFGSFGMLMPRYCKPAWPKKTWCGKKIWFQIHQPAMIITLLLTAVAFIIIFVEADGYVSDLPSPSSAHPPLGIIVMILVLINPLMAVFRCEPDNKKRIIFNICHFIVGLLAQLTAVVTVFLGLYTPQLDLPMWTKAVMAAFICFHAIIEVILAVHMHRNKFSQRGSKDSDGVPMTFASYAAGEPREKPTAKRNSGSRFISGVLAAYLVGVLSFTIAIAVQIGVTSSS